MVDKSLRPSFSSIKIGKRTLRNRLIMPAHSYGFSNDPAGCEQLVSYVRRRLENQVALVVIGEAEVICDTSDTGGGQSRPAGSLSSQLYSKLASIRDEFGGLIIEQLYHPGGQVWFEERRPSYAPSEYPQARSYSLPVALRKSDVEEIRESFIHAAQVCCEQGLDGVEIKADQGKLIHQFLSSEFNQRGDEYGGSLDNRSKFLVEVLEGIRGAVSEDFILGVRLAGEVTPILDSNGDPLNADISLEETKQILQILEKRGLVDYVSVSGETNSSVWGYRQNHGDETISAGTFLSVTRELKLNSSLPIVSAGKIQNLTQADQAIERGDCDIVAMARALIADAELITKDVSTEKTDPVRPCLSCNISCVGRTWYGNSIACVYDPLSGRESLFKDSKNYSLEDTRIAVVGAGPAGLEFCRTASALGAKIDLFEKSDRIGGALNAWAKLPFSQNMRMAIDFWKASLDRQKATRVFLNSQIEPGDIDSYDKVIWAAGAYDSLPVFLAHNSVVNLSIVQALNRLDWEGKTVFVVDADRFQDPVGTAIWIAKSGGTVSIVTPFDQICVEMDPVSRASRIAAIKSLNIPVFEWSDVRMANKTGHVYLLDHCTNTALEKRTQLVVWGVNRHPSVCDRMGAEVVTTIGDAKWPTGLHDAVIQGHDTAIELAQAMGEER